MCDFCSKKKPRNWDNLMGRGEFKNESLANDLDAIINGNTLVFDYDAYSTDSSFYEEVKINFCPMCGIKL